MLEGFWWRPATKQEYPMRVVIVHAFTHASIKSECIDFYRKKLFRNEQF